MADLVVDKFNVPRHGVIDVKDTIAHTEILNIKDVIPEGVSSDNPLASQGYVDAEIKPIADRDCVIISSNQTVVAATNSQVITSYATGDNDLQNGTGSGSAYSGFIMNLKEYATLALANQGISNVAVKTVSLQQIMVRVRNYSTALKMYVYDDASGEQLMVSNSTGTADNAKRERIFVFPTSPVLKADKQYKFVIVNADDTAVNSGIRLYDSIQIPVPSYQWIGISGDASSAPNRVFQGTITFAYEGLASVDLITRGQGLALFAQQSAVVHNTGDEEIAGHKTFTGALTIGSRAANSTVGAHSVAEGNGTTASGAFSHAEGGGTTAQNVAEHAQGQRNVSHKASDTFGDAGNTLSSIGCGVSEPKNAVETMQDGKTFVLGMGGYDGTNPTGSGVRDLATVVNTLDGYPHIEIDTTTGAPVIVIP